MSNNLTNFIPFHPLSLSLSLLTALPIFIYTNNFHYPQQNFTHFDCHFALSSPSFSLFHSLDGVIIKERGRERRNKSATLGFSLTVKEIPFLASFSLHLRLAIPPSLLSLLLSPYKVEEKIAHKMQKKMIKLLLLLRI
jgi:hypothetical protein